MGASLLALAKSIYYEKNNFCHSVMLAWFSISSKCFNFLQIQPRVLNNPLLITAFLHWTKVIAECEFQLTKLTTLFQ